MQIGILEKKDFSQKAIKQLRNIGRVNFFDEGELKNFIKDKDIIFIRLGHYIGREILSNADNLKFICSPTTGLNHLDLDEIKNKNISLVSLKGESAFLSTIRATPEHALGLTLALLRNYKRAFLNENNREWNRDKFKGYEVYEKNVGIIGFGRIGQILAKYFSALDAQVFFYDVDTNIKPCFNAKRLKDVEKLIEKCEIVLLCASYNPRNPRILDKYHIDLLENKYFINTSRNELIDELYLIERIRDNFFKGIALDVIVNENKGDNLKELILLTKNRNFILTPHISGATYESMEKTEIFLVNKLKKLLEKKN